MIESFDLWLEYLVRFSHLVAGISWIGSSFYFIWLDSSFEPLKVPRENVEGEVFMVHGGFYYQVDKKKIAPNQLPENLHWFKWEATLTWITGVMLLVILYYLNGASLLLKGEGLIQSQSAAIFSSIFGVIISWVIYDLIWHPESRLPQSLKLISSVIYFTGLIYFYFEMFSGRGAFIQTGVTFGSIMLFNVWMRILPGQRKIVNAALEGKLPDYSLSLKSKTRSVHNTYFTFPVLFIMISNHYPLLYNHRNNWILLIVLMIAGALVRHTMVTKNKKERWLLLPAFVALLGLFFATEVKSLDTGNGNSVSYSEIKLVVEQRCLQCHSQNPTDDIFKEPPKGLILESEGQLLAVKEKLLQQVVIGQGMPLANKTKMTEEERALFAKWLTAVKN